jgi:hypothetical protein
MSLDVVWIPFARDEMFLIFGAYIAAWAGFHICILVECCSSCNDDACSNSAILNHMQTEVKSMLNKILHASNVNVDKPNFNPTISRVSVIVSGNHGGTVQIEVIDKQ